jgi:hypothetical protein
VPHGREKRIDSSTVFFRRQRSAKFLSQSGQRREPREFSVTFVSRLSVVAAYVVFAFVGAIVLGVF